jgi:hypothetical protein
MLLASYMHDIPLKAKSFEVQLLYTEKSVKEHLAEEDVPIISI